MSHDSFEKYKFRVEQEVNRYKELIASERFLSGGFDFKGYEIIHDQEKANDLYTDQDPPLPYFSYPDLLDEVVPSFFIPYYVEIQDKIRSIWSRLDENLWLYVSNEISKKNLQSLQLADIDNFIYNDFLSIISYKSSDSEIDKHQKIFLEKQLEVYQNGGFPCGWKGEFPEGEMVVYSPK